MYKRQGDDSAGENGGNENGNGKSAAVRFLNFKPEIATAYEEIAAKYKEETGKTVIVETAANNTYEQTLSAKMATSEAPTIFQVNGPRGYANWKETTAPICPVRSFTLILPTRALLSQLTEKPTVSRTLWRDTVSSTTMK